MVRRTPGASGKDKPREKAVLRGVGGKTSVPTAELAKSPLQAPPPEKKRRGRPPKPRTEYEGPALEMRETEIRQISLSSVRMDDLTFQPRFSTKPDDLLETIQNHGIQIPLVLRSSPDNPEQYQIVCGFRRAAAARKLGLKSVPAIVRSLDDEAANILSFTENEYRKTLRDLDRAHAIAKLQRGGLVIAQIAARLRLSDRHIQRLKRLLDYPKEVVAAMDDDDNPLPTTHAIAIMQAKERQGEKFDLAHWVKTGRRGLSVAELSRAMRRARSAAPGRSDFAGNRKGKVQRVVTKAEGGQLITFDLRSWDSASQKEREAAKSAADGLAELLSTWC